METEVVDHAQRPGTERGQELVVVQGRCLVNQRCNVDRVVECVWQREPRERRERARRGTKDRQVTEQCSTRAVDCRAIAIQPIEQFVGERGKAAGVDTLKDTSSMVDIQLRAYLPQSRAEWLDLSRVGDEEAVDKQLEHGGFVLGRRPHDLGRRRDHAIAARDDRDVTDAIDVRDLARKAFERLEDLVTSSRVNGPLPGSNASVMPVDLSRSTTCRAVSRLDLIRRVDGCSCAGGGEGAVRLWAARSWPTRRRSRRALRPQAVRRLSGAHMSPPIVSTTGRSGTTSRSALRYVAAWFGCSVLRSLVQIRDRAEELPERWQCRASRRGLLPNPRGHVATAAMAARFQSESYPDSKRTVLRSVLRVERGVHVAGQSARRLGGQRRVEHTGGDASIGRQGDRHRRGSLRIDESSRHGRSLAELPRQSLQSG